MSTALQELDSGTEVLFESPATGDVAALISKNTARSIAQFGKYEKQTLVRLRSIYEEGWHRMESTIMLRGVRRRAGAPLSMDETIRLSMMKRQLEEEMRVMEGKLRELVPGQVKGAGNLGEMAGASELDILLKEIPRIGFPQFAIVNRQAVEFYANYALTTTIDYGQEALAAIKRRLDMALVTGEAYGPVVRDVRKLMLEKRGMAMTGVHYKANRVVRTELARAYAGGHTAYGQACDFVIGEKHNIQMGACEECIALIDKEYIFADGDFFEIVHPFCHCYPTYIYSKKLFTDEELTRLEPEKLKPLMTYEGTVNSEAERILRRGLATKTEHGCAIDSSGKIVMKRAGKSSDVVTLTPNDLEKMRIGKAKIFIHNHPGGASFSAGDIDFGARMDLGEMMAVGKKYKYTIKPRPGGRWPTEDLDELTKMWNSARSATQAKYDALYRESGGMLDWQELYRQQTHEMWEGMSKKLGLIYKRST